jgi:hypothetical protein
MVLSGCQYGFSRAALEGGEYAPPGRTSFSVGYAAGWGAAPWYFSASYRYAYPYPYAYDPWWYPPPYYYYDPWWYYPRSYWYPPYYYRPIVVKPAPRRTIRTDSGISAPAPSTPSTPSGKSRRRFDLP